MSLEPIYCIQLLAIVVSLEPIFCIQLLAIVGALKCELIIVAYSCLIDELRKIGKLKIAWELFQSLPRTGLMPNVVTYNIMIHGLCDDGANG